MAETAVTVTVNDAVQDENTLKRIQSAESHWTWKASIRTVTSILSVVAIGCTAWVLANPTILNENPYIGIFEFDDTLIPAVVILSLSSLWCLGWIFIPFLLRPARPLHPGIAVGFDLLLWLGFIVVALFATAGVFSLADFGSDPTNLADPSSSYSGGLYYGSYYLAPNNTWIYNITDTNLNTKHWNETTLRFEYDGFNASAVTRACMSEFASCADQDAFVNRLWREKSKRFAIEVVVVVIQWLSVLLHFTLFVWACVDTRRYNQFKYLTRDRLTVDRVMADLERKGLISTRRRVDTQGQAPPMTNSPHRLDTNTGRQTDVAPLTTEKPVEG